MLYILGTIAVIAIIYGLLLFLKRGNKEFSPKLSLKERTELEKIVEKKAREEEAKAEEKKVNHSDEIDKVAEPIIPKTKTFFPSKEIHNEVSRFSTHIDLDNVNVQHSIRSGVQNFSSENFMVALEEFSLAIESNSKDAVGFYLRGLTKLKLKNYESAISDFSEAINLKIKDPNTLYYRALAYYNLHDIDNAIVNLKGYLNQETNSAEAYYDLGICFRDKEKVEEAIKNFSLAVQKRPAYESAYFERGLLRHKLGDIEGCCSDLKKALGLGYLEAESSLNELCNRNSP